MINKAQIESFQMEVDSKIYILEALRKELELEILNNLMSGVEVVETQKNFEDISSEIKSLKDMKLEASIRYNEQFITFKR